MIYVKSLLIALLVSLSFTLKAQEEQSLQSAFIIDELFIYAHAGAGTNFRILGSINAGTEISITGLTENGYSQVIDAKNRKVWIESKYITEKPGLRFVIAELTQKLTNAESSNINTSEQLTELNQQIESLENEKSALASEVTSLNNTILAIQSQLDSQDIDTKKEWFFTGAIVLGVGLIFGLVLPRLAGRKKSSMDSWK